MIHGNEADADSDWIVHSTHMSLTYMNLTYMREML